MFNERGRRKRLTRRRNYTSFIEDPIEINKFTETGTSLIDLVAMKVNKGK